MATDPSSIIQGMLQSAGLGRTVSDFQQQDAQTQGMNLRNQAAQMQMSQEQAQAQRMQAFQTALTGFGSDPSDGNLARIALQFPEQVDTLKKQKQLLDAPVLNSHKTYFSGLERVAGAGNTKLATQQLQSMITAEKAQGHDTSEAEDMLSAIGAGEPDALKRVQAFAKGQLYVIDPDYAAAVDKSHATDNANHFTSTGDGAIYDQRSGVVTRQAPDKPAKWRFDENSGSWLQEPGSGSTGGGGLVSSGPAAGNRGDVSRLINTDAGGGYLPDSVQTLGQFVGYGKAMNKSGAKSSSAGIYQINGTTMAEFGPKALGKDWKSAPFNAATQDRVGKEIFNWAKSQPDPAAALRGRWVSLSPDAASQLVKGNWEQARGVIAQGETGGAPGASANAGTGNGSPAVVKVLPGKTKEQFRILDASEVPAGLDPNIRYQVSPNGQITPLGGQKQGNLKPWPAAALAARVQNDSSLKNITSTLSLLDPRNNSVEAQRARKATGPGTGLLSNYVTDNITDPNGVDFRARIGQIGGIIIKDTSGAAVSISEDSRLAKWVPKVTDTTSQVRAKLANLKREIQQRNQAMEETYTEDQGFRPLHAQNVPAGPPPGAIQMLMNNPKLRSAFDAKYGKGAAARVLK